jgi:cyclohexa-1,5-dienecarbonyl-CoA hydratase
MPDPKGKQPFVPDMGSGGPPKFRHFKFQVSCGAARFTLDRPEHNLLNETVLRELAEGIAQAGQDNDVKVLVLDSAGKVFCGGVDIAEYTADRAFQMVDAFHSLFSGILNLNKPVIAVVNGPAIGGGAELVAFCDLILASPRARFALPEVTIGIFPPLATAMMPHLVGPKMAMELVLTGEPVWWRGLATVRALSWQWPRKRFLAAWDFRCSMQ